MLRLAAAAALAALPAVAQDTSTEGAVAEKAAAEQAAEADAAAQAATKRAAAEAAAEEAARWGPVAEGLGLGTGICLDSEKIVCALVLCEDGALTFGVLGTGEGGELPAFRGQVEVDGETVERDMQGRVLIDDSYYVRTPIEPDDPLWQRLRAGNSLALASSADAERLDYTLRGSAAELDRVAAACR